jgi:hypothetical protein
VTLLLGILERRRAHRSLSALAAFSCLVAAQIVFWTVTFPANQATHNWTVIPANWMRRADDFRDDADTAGGATRAAKGRGNVDGNRPGPVASLRMTGGRYGFLFVQLWWPTFQAPSSSSSSIVPY